MLVSSINKVKNIGQGFSISSTICTCVLISDNEYGSKDV